jgi:hypothetical protein
MQEDHPVAARNLIGFLAFAFIGASIQSVVDNGWEDNSRALWAFLFGLVLLVLAGFWKSAHSFLGERLSASISNVASDFRVWLAVLVAVWAYGAISSIVILNQRTELEKIIKQDIVPFRMALEKWVIPRRLTAEQIESLGKALSKSSQQTVSFTIIQNDQEASTYAGDISRAVRQGGWNISHITQEANVREGLTIHFLQTMASSQMPDDPRNPKPDRILQDAFREAGVYFDGNSGGSGGNITQNMLSIHVGARRRDSHWIDKPWRAPR